MAGKFDKEMLKKHHFWFLFIPVAIALLLTWFGLFAEVPDAISGTEEKNAKSAGELKNVNAKSKAMIGEFAKEVKDLTTQRESMWKIAWNEQKNIFVWPKGYSVPQLDVVKNLKFGDEISDRASVRLQFRDPAVYHAEYDKLIEELKPMTFRDDWKRVLSYAEKMPKRPSSEDMWLAMEDLWIQRDILTAIDKVNLDAAKFKKVDFKNPDGSPKKDDPKHRLFRSRNWEADLQIVDDGKEIVLKGKLTNVSDRLQVTGINNSMKLKIKFSSDARREFTCVVEGTSAEVGQSLEIKPIKRKGAEDLNVINTEEFRPLAEIAEVKQEFDVRTVPIKRIEHFVIGKLSDRNYILPLRMSKFSEKEYAKETASTATPATPGSTASPSNPTSVMPPGGFGSGTGDSAATNKSQNGLERFRYIDVTEQVRRLPFAVAVVTDQTYMKDILEELANTKLRLQTTQIDWTRFHGTLNYGTPPVGSGPMMTGPMAGPGPGFDTRGGMPGSFGAAPTNNREDQFSANLLELSVYGILSIYERFPDDKQTKATTPTAVPKPKLEPEPVKTTPEPIKPIPEPAKATEPMKTPEKLKN